MTTADSEFLSYVRNYVSTHPEVAAYVQQHVAAGISDSLTEAMQRAADMETALALALSRKYGGSEALIADMIKKWEHRAALKWDWAVEKLMAKTKGSGL
jgi:hypothetical protein